MPRVPTVPFALRTCLALGTCLAMVGCATADRERGADNAAIRRIGADVDRICALLEPQRSEELKKLEQESGYELQCGRK
jgi:hypothetical protein